MLLFDVGEFATPEEAIALQKPFEKQVEKDGSLLPTRDRVGNPMFNTHNTGERVSD